MDPTLMLKDAAWPSRYYEREASAESLLEQANNTIDLQEKTKLLEQALSLAVSSNQPSPGFESARVLHAIGEAYYAKSYKGEKGTLDAFVLTKRAESCALGLLLNQVSLIFSTLPTQIDFTFLTREARDSFFQHMDAFIASNIFLAFINASTSDKELLAGSMTKLLYSYKNLGNEELYYSTDAYSKEEIENKNYRARLLNLYQAIDHIYSPQKGNPTKTIIDFYYNTTLLKNFLENPGAIDEAMEAHQKIILTWDPSPVRSAQCFNLYHCVYMHYYDHVKQSGQEPNGNILHNANQYAQECDTVEASINLADADPFDVHNRKGNSASRFLELFNRTNDVQALVKAYEHNVQAVQFALNKQEEGWHDYYSMWVLRHIGILVAFIRVNNQEIYRQEISKCFSIADQKISAESSSQTTLSNFHTVYDKLSSSS